MNPQVSLLWHLCAPQAFYAHCNFDFKSQTDLSLGISFTASSKGETQSIFSPTGINAAL